MATLLAWLKLVALGGALAGAEPKTLRRAARRRPPRARRSAPDPQGRRQLAVGRPDHRGMDADRRAGARALSGASACPAHPASPRTVEPPDTRPASRARLDLARLFGCLPRWRSGAEWTFWVPAASRARLRCRRS